MARKSRRLPRPRVMLALECDLSLLLSMAEKMYPISAAKQTARGRKEASLSADKEACFR